MKNLTDAIKEACRLYSEDSGDVVNVSTYSGRGMCGKVCPSISVSRHEFNEIIVLVILAIQGDPEFECMLKSLINYRSDSMGLGSVFYWPDLDC